MFRRIALLFTFTLALCCDVSAAQFKKPKMTLPNTPPVKETQKEFGYSIENATSNSVTFTFHGKGNSYTAAAGQKLTFKSTKADAFVMIGSKRFDIKSGANEIVSGKSGVSVRAKAAVAGGGGAATTAEKQLAWGAKVSKEFRDKVRKVARNLNVDPDHLMAVMSFETSGTFRPDIRNPDSNAVGLIQFTRTTAIGLGTTTDELAKMTAVRQLDYVEKHFKPYSANVKTVDDAYMVVFCPRAVGKKSDYVLYSRKDGNAYKHNSALDSDHDGQITKEEAASKLRTRLKDGLKSGNSAA